MKRALLSILPIMLFSGSAASGDAGSRSSVPLRLESGRVMTLNLKKTAGAGRDERLPVLLVFGGFQNAAKVLDLIEPTRKVILASFDYPFDPPRKFAFPSGLRLLPEARRMVHWTREGIHKAVTFLREHPDVDPARISILGASLGAPFALLGASDRPEIRGVIVIHGFGRVADTISHQFQRNWKKRFGFLSWPLAWALGRLAWASVGLPSPEQCAGGLLHDQKLLVINAEKDSFIPAPARAALREAARSSGAGEVTLIETPGDHLQPGKKKLLSELLAMVTEWLEARELI